MKSVIKNLVHSSVLIFTLIFASQASAGVIVADAGWYGFCFDGVGSGAEEGCQNQGIGVAGNTIEFTLVEDAWLKVTDAFSVGDIFDVFINSTLAFTTSTPGDGLSTANPDVAFDSGYFSAGAMLLGAGSYEVDIIVAASPFGSGGGYVALETATSVPEPGSLALLGLGLIGAGFMRKRK